MTSPPAGGGKLAAERTGNFAITARDLKSTIPVNSPTPVTVTLPPIDAAFPRGYAVGLVNAGTTAVTIVSTATIIGTQVTPAGSVVLQSQGGRIRLTANKFAQWEAAAVS